MSISIQEAVHEGWLTKSPPTTRIWRARWRRRWFALKQSRDLPGQYFLEYYTDRNCRKLKGRIDLDQCEQVDVGLRFERHKQKYQHMFDVKTPGRTYYLAADNEVEMTGWVECICQVCGLKSDVDGTTTTEYYQYGPGTSANTSVEQEFRISPTPSTISGPYIPISECISGAPLPSPMSPEEMNSLLYENCNELSPLSPTSIPPSYMESLNHSLNSYDPRFYDIPRTLRPSSNLKVNNISHSNGHLTNSNNNITNRQISVLYNSKAGKIKTRPPNLVLGASKCSPGNSPTDSESVFTEDEWTHPVLPQGSAGPRPSDSSIENETVPWSIVQRFSRMTVEPVPQNSISNTNPDPILEVPEAPPRPPKPTHLQQDQHGYLNIDSVDKSPNAYSNNEIKLPLIGPRTASTIVTDEFYDIPRSHQPELNSDIKNNRHNYTNAAPSSVTNIKSGSSIFTFDLIGHDKADPADKDSQVEQESPCSPITPDTPLSLTDSINIATGKEDEPASPASLSSSYSALEPSISDAKIGNTSPAPIVNRCLKPRRNASPPPSIDRKLKPPTPSNSRANARQGFLAPNTLHFGKPLSGSIELGSPYEGVVTLRRPRAAPSPTPPKEGGSDDDNTTFPDDPNFYPINCKHIPITPPGTSSHILQYIDLDLDPDTVSTAVLRSPKSYSTVYKTVDFVKTEAVKRTKETAEECRTVKQKEELKKK